MRATLILLYCIFVSNVFCQVTHEWNFTTPGNDEDRVTDLAITFDDNLLIAGFYSDRMVFPDANYSSVGEISAFVSMVSSTGEFLWSMSLNSLQSSGEIYIHKLIPTVDGGFIAAGRFNGRVDVDSGPEEKIYNSDLTDVFVVKYSDELELLWSFTSDLNDSNDNTLLDAYMDGDGYLYSSGLYSRPQSGLGTVMIVNKMDTLGNELWTYEVEAEGYNHFTSIDVYDGHIYVSGNFTGMADFDSDPDSELIYQSESSSNVICKLDTDGNLLWAKKIDGVAYGHHLELSTVGEIFVGGFFRDTVDFDPGVEEQFVVVDDYSPFMIKLDSDGILKWVWTKPENGSVQKLIRDESDGMNFIVKGESIVFGNMGSEGVFNFATYLSYDNTSNCTPTELAYKNDSFYIGVDNLDGFQYLPSGQAVLESSSDFDYAVAKYSIQLSNIDNFLELKDLEIYPNPASEFLFVTSEDDVISDIYIFSSSGLRMKSKRNIESQSVKLDVDDLPSGIYLLKMEIGGRFVTETFVKE